MCFVYSPPFSLIIWLDWLSFWIPQRSCSFGHICIGFIFQLWMLHLDLLPVFVSLSLYLQNPVFSLKKKKFSYYSVIIFMPVCFSFYLHSCLMNKDHWKGEKKGRFRECDVFVFSTFYIILLFGITGDVKVRARGALANATCWEKKCDQCVTNTWTSIAFNTEWYQIDMIWYHHGHIWGAVCMYGICNII